MLTYPDRLTFSDWAPQLIIDLPANIIPDPPDEVRWREWAQNVVYATQPSNVGLPSPYEFSDWRAWAEAACRVVNDGVTF